MRISRSSNGIIRFFLLSIIFFSVCCQNHAQYALEVSSSSSENVFSIILFPDHQQVKAEYVYFSMEQLLEVSNAMRFDCSLYLLFCLPFGIYYSCLKEKVIKRSL